MNYQARVQNIFQISAGLIVGNQYFAWDSLKGQCTSGTFSPRGLWTCVPCPEGWLSSAGDGICSYMSWRLFCTRVAIPMALFLALLVAVIGQGYAPVPPASAEAPVSHPMAFELEDTACANSNASWTKWRHWSTWGALLDRVVGIAGTNRLAALAALVCFALAYVCEPGNGYADSTVMSFVMWTGVLIALLLCLPGPRQGWSTVRAMLTPLLGTLLVVQAQCWMMLALTFQNINPSLESSGAQMALDEDRWSSFWLLVANCLSIFSAEITRQQGCSLEASSNLQEEENMLDRCCQCWLTAVVQDLILQVREGIATGIALHLLAFGNDVYTIVIYYLQLLEAHLVVGGDNLNAQKQTLIFSTLLTGCVSLSMHGTAVLAIRLGHQYPRLLAFEDRHFRGSVFCRFLLIFFKLIYLASPNEMKMKECSHGEPCDVQYAWSCFGEGPGYCPAACTEKMHGSCIVATQNDLSLQCVCIGVRPIRHQVVASTMISLVVIFCMTGMRTWRFWRYEPYLRASTFPRLGLLCLGVITLGPQIWLVWVTEHLAAAKPDLYRASQLVNHLLVGFASLLPAVLLANECKWTLASWSPPQNFLARGALRCGAASAVPALQSLASVAALFGAVTSAADLRWPRAFVALLGMVAAAAPFVPHRCAPRGP
ncbi:unnamed protein product [Effrenium voratum]|nr:unnamed protein product [Effrenium voratum]